VSRIIDWFVHNSVTANLLFVLLVVGGLVALPTIKLEVFPESNQGRVTVSVEYLGAAPQEVEEGICRRIEEQIQGITGIERVTSVASEGMGVVTAEILAGENARSVLDDIKARVDAIDTFPEESERPHVSEVIIRRAVVDVAVSGPVDERTLREIASQVRDDILALPGITVADLVSVRDYEISIEVSEQALRRHRLTFDDVATAVRRSSLDLPGGSLKTSAGEILLRAKGQAYRGAEFERIPVVTRTDGTRVVLSDVATVVDGFEEDDRWTRFDGEPAAIIQVFRVGDQNAPAVAEAVERYIAESAGWLPRGVSLTTWQDDSEYFADRLSMLVRNGSVGLVLVLIALSLFMRLRLAFWVSMGIPVSLFGTFALMPLFGISVNIVSLFAFILVLGILVDNAIVVGENVYVLRETEMNGLRAASKGTAEVATPVIFAVLTSITAFVPVAFAPGTMGQMFDDVGFVATACLGCSLVGSLLILPARFGRIRWEEEVDDSSSRWRRLQARFAGALGVFVREVYVPRLRGALRKRRLVAATAMAVLLLMAGFVGGGWMRFVFFPDVGSTNVTALLTMPVGTPVEATGRAMERVEEAIKQVIAEIESPADGSGEIVVRHRMLSVGEQPSKQRLASISGSGRRGGAGSHLAEINVELVPPTERVTRIDDVAHRWRARTGAIPDAVELVFNASRFDAGDPIDIELRGPDVEELRAVAAELRAALALYPGVFDITDTFRGGKQEVRLAIRPSAETLGLTLDDLAHQVRQAFYGEEAQRIQRGADDVKVMVRYPPDERRSLSDLGNLRVRTPEGAEVPFATVAHAELGQGFSNIRRTDRQRVVAVRADLDTTASSAGEVLGRLQSPSSARSSSASSVASVSHSSSSTACSRSRSAPTHNLSS
jgi:multidrug efflux pump subunit AcrB